MDRLDRKQRGRPRSGQNPILNQVRLSPELIDLLSRRALAEGTTRSELIRRLVEAGLHETHRSHAGFRQLPQGARQASSARRSAVLRTVRGLPRAERD